jgi:lysophospholipase L1-like esterase
MYFRNIGWGILLTFAGVAAGLYGQTQPAMTAPATTATATAASRSNAATLPVTWLEKDSYDWDQRHKDILSVQKQVDPEIVLIGDSITHFWSSTPPQIPAAKNNIRGPKAWTDTFGDHKVLNMGFGWDRTQNVLWRLDHGEMDDCHPKVVVLNIGTNNFSGTAHAPKNTPEEVAEAIGAIVERVQKKAPECRVMVMGIFPRGAMPTDAFRAPIKATNALLAKQFADQKRVTFLDIGPQLVEADGSMARTMMADGVHPTEKGYAIWGKALVEAGIFK